MPLLKSPPSARADALGGSLAAVADRSESIFWNPAGIAKLYHLGDSDLSLGYNALIETAYTGTVCYARPFAGIGVFGFGLLYAAQSSIQGYNAVGDTNGSFTPNDLVMDLSYGRRLGAVLAGLGLKFIRSQVADVSGTSFALDLGVQMQSVWKPSEGPIDIGLSLQNLGPPLKMGGGSDPLPTKIQGGFAWHFNERFSGLLDGHLPVDQEPYVSLGAEGRLPVASTIKAGLRGGYNMSYSRGVPGFAGVTAGFGLEVERFRVDYAWVPFGDLGSSNRFSLGYRF